ncbi:MAG: DUF2306 domain-containing protein [Pseudomonadota bacterium]
MLRGLGALATLLSLGVALVAGRYLLPTASIPEVVATNTFRQPWLALHAVSAATALLTGPWQFLSTLRSHLPSLHRWTGRVYTAACVIGGTTGFVLALGASTGLVSTAGFGLLAVTWTFCTVMGWQLAMGRDFIAHRRWMIRSFALTFAAVTLRLYLPIAPALPVSFENAYRCISFLCWVPNLLLAELYLRQRRLQKA